MSKPNLQLQNCVLFRILNHQFGIKTLLVNTMTKHTLFLFLLTLSLVFGLDIHAEEIAHNNDLTQTVLEIEQDSTETMVESMALSEALTRITGTAIYPVFGLAFLGLWDHLEGAHSWYATPWLYVPLFFLMFLDFLKNTVGLALGPLKKGADVALQGLDFINAHLGLFMSVGIAANSFQPVVQDTTVAVLNTLIPVASASTDIHVEYTIGSILLMGIAGLLGGLIYFVIWVTMQTFSLLILLSPFNSLDSLLRTLQVSAISVLTISFLIFPPLAVVVASCYILIAALLFRTCWSYLQFATRLLWALIFKRGTGTVDLAVGIECFADDISDTCPERTVGLLTVVDNTLVFERHSLLGKDIHHPIECDRMWIQKGTLYPTLEGKDGDRTITLAIFSPIYQTKETELATVLQCTVEPSTLLKGFSKSLEYIKSQYRRLTQRQGTTPAT